MKIIPGGKEHNIIHILKIYSIGYDRVVFQGVTESRFVRTFVWDE